MLLLSQRSLTTLPPLPAVSVVIPTFERRNSLLQCLGRLADCCGSRDIEVIVVDQSSTPLESSDCAALTANFRSFRIICRAEPNLPAARNAGALVAQAPILLFLDDDVDVGAEYIARLLLVFAQQLTDVVGAPALPIAAAPATAKLAVAEWLPGTNVALRRDHFFAVRGYDENFPQYNEDAEFSHRLRRAGLRLHFCLDLEIAHRSEPSGGIRHARSLPQAARTALRSDLYFTRAIGGGFLRLLQCAMAATRGELRGRGRLQGGSMATRLLACAAAIPGAVLYAFRRPLLLPAAGCSDRSELGRPAAQDRFRSA